jgi:hypothetical protein
MVGDLVEEFHTHIAPERGSFHAGYHEFMKDHHDKMKKTTPRTREPVQVYMAPGDSERLDRLTDELDTTKSDVLRRGLEALERQLLDPEHHPALRIIGIAGEETADEV